MYVFLNDEKVLLKLLLINYEPEHGQFTKDIHKKNIFFHFLIKTHLQI